MKFWIISGDKTHTIERIAKSIDLITPSTKTMFFTDPKRINVEDFKIFNLKYENLLKKYKVIAIIEGAFFEQVYSYCDTNKALYRKFVRLWLQMDGCLFCRVVD